MDHQSFTWADVSDDRVAWDRTTTLRKGDKHAIRAFNRQVAVIRLRNGRHHGFALLQIFSRPLRSSRCRDDFRQQIVKRCQLHTIQFALNIFLRNFRQLTTTA
ncbi:Uncharacterised protein [Salmonella enterica subsp. enterica]|uniref:Uncharacterized protein n=1 Tax=Salmonella enterica I TaxID=59201 RepID=A0A447P3S9_SALET|nr:Uncharacterised protein [Salmonella enterica subsp. enterica]